MAKCRNVDIKTAIRIVTEAAKEYDARLNDRHFMVVYMVEYPVTLVNGDVRKMIDPACKVLEIFLRRHNAVEICCIYTVACGAGIQ